MQKTAIRKDSGVGRVFMVAGARNRHYLHLYFVNINFQVATAHTSRDKGRAYTSSDR